MAEAAAIGIPAGLTPSDVKLMDTNTAGPVAEHPVQQGKTYTFTKYVARVPAELGRDAQETLALAKAARNDAFDKLLSDHRAQERQEIKRHH